VIAPYPFSRLPHYRRAEAALLTRLSAHGAIGPSSAAALDAAAELLGAPLDTALGVPELWAVDDLTQHLPGELSAIALVARHAARDRALVLELSRELAAAVTDRALGGDARTLAPDEPLDPLELGVLGYVAARCAAHTRGALRVSAALRSPIEVLAALGITRDERVLVLPIRVALGDTHGHARLLLTSLPSTDLAPRPLDVPEALCSLPVTLCAHATTVTLTTRELAGLEAGDIVLPERALLSRGAQGWYGQLAVHALGTSACHALCATLEAGSLALERQASMRAPRAERGKRSMDAQDEEETHGERIARDAPIELCLELARFVVPLEELLALKPGAVWSTGRAIGEHVTLTAAGRSVARGELVEIDGEIGVRILERA
jgi:flagellar motor switch/type III secretory pathway protein FliN